MGETLAQECRRTAEVLRRNSASYHGAASLLDRAADALTWRTGLPPEGEMVLLWTAENSVRPEGFYVGKREHYEFTDAAGKIEGDKFLGVPTPFGVALWLPIPPLPPRETESETGGGK